LVSSLLNDSSFHGFHCNGDLGLIFGLNNSRFDGSGPTAELAAYGEGVVAVLEANLAEVDRLTSLLVIAYPQQHGFAVKVIRLTMGNDCQINAGVGEHITPATEVAYEGFVESPIATAIILGP
jgi:hypothetical protein